VNTSPELIASLNTDLALEHGAILQYVVHGVQLRDSALGDLLRRTSREEMWHLEWLVEAIKARGGEPTLERADIFTSASITESIEVDTITEDGALEHYAATLELIGDTDPGLTELISRIVDDERHHRHAFAALAEKVAADGDAAHTATPAIDPKEFAVIGPVIGTEYGNVLQYLWNKYGAHDCEAEETYFELAVDEMRHVLWAALYTPGFGKPQAPPLPPEWVAMPGGAKDARRMADELEERSEGFYSAIVGQAEDPELRNDLERAAVQHAYHRGTLKRMEDEG
jgi:bacterioferritin